MRLIIVYKINTRCACVRTIFAISNLSEIEYQWRRVFVVERENMYGVCPIFLQSTRRRRILPVPTYTDNHIYVSQM